MRNVAGLVHIRLHQKCAERVLYVDQLAQAQSAIVDVSNIHVAFVAHLFN